MTPEERELRRALSSRSGEPSAEYRARLARALGEERPAARSTNPLAVLVAVFLAVAIIAVLVLARQGAHPTPAPGGTSVSRSKATPTPLSSPSPTPVAGPVVGSIAMFGDNGWATTLDQAGPVLGVLRTGDGGRTWRSVVPASARSSFILGFSPIDGSRAWFIAQRGNSGSGPVDLWSTQDGGLKWSRTAAPAIVYRGALITFSDGTHGWLASPGEPMSQEQQQGIVIDRTVDGGKTWRLVAQSNFPPGRTTAGAPSLSCGKSDLSFLDASTGWLTGGCTSGITFDVTTDGGVTWKAEPLAGPRGMTFLTACEGGPCSLTAPRFAARGFAYMVLNDTSLYPVRSWFYESRDNGESWTIHPLPGQETKVVMLNSSVGYASVGVVTDSTGSAVNPAAPWLYRTDDGGTSWKPINANRQLSYAALNCDSATKCWAVSPSLNGPDPTTRLYLSTDGGRTWSEMPTP
jgi:photosystem II stability/assembly factor-like uncharacterized protein